MRNSLLVVLTGMALNLVHPGLLNAQVTYELADGFESEQLFSYDAGAPFALQLGGLASGPEGETIVNENGEIRLHSAAGTRTLASFQPAVFGSFLTIGPEGRNAWYGESSEQNIYRVPLDGSGPELVARIGYNFDMAFAPAEAPTEIAAKALISGL